jgi:hypothetical protein
MSSSGDDNKILVDKITEDEIKTPFGAKDTKATVVKDRKLVIAACKAVAAGEKKEHGRGRWEKKEHLISAKAKAAQARSKVDRNCTKLAEATNGAGGLTLPGWGTSLAKHFSSHSHSHKKSRGIPGSFSSVHPPVVAFSCPRSKRQQPRR